MRNDFLPVHLMNANAKLDKHVLAVEANKKKHDAREKGESLWKKFIGLFKR
ncbi:hypothetical protein [Sulfurovum sp.]|uniref:hypothetical protein n=1 Tax=Sulfurovum sp. TaxID=1969726 RepID=UPI002868154C|nr:hypothetical protein [Sulfurovum sp.]